MQPGPVEIKNKKKKYFNKLGRIVTIKTLEKKSIFYKL